MHPLARIWCSLSLDVRPSFHVSLLRSCVHRVLAAVQARTRASCQHARPVCSYATLPPPLPPPLLHPAQAMNIGVALPTFMFSTDRRVAPLMLLGLVCIGILLPLGLACWCVA